MSDESTPPPEDPTTQAPAEKPPGAGMPKWLLPAGAAVIIIGLVIALIVVLSGGGGGDETPKAAAATGPSAEYLSAVKAPLRRLNASAQVTGRTLTRASKAADLGTVSRSAKQQLAVVQNARSRIADIPTGKGERAARNALSRATQSHRTLLTSLSRLGDLDAKGARGQLVKIRSQARASLDQYRAFFAAAPSLPKGLTTAGLADISGLTQAVADKRAAEEEAARAAEEERQRQRTDRDSGGPSRGGGSGALSVSGASGSDLGSVIQVSANYCDRTPGAVNSFIYTFQVSAGDAVVASDSYSASQTRACNTVSMNFDDRFGIGSYQVSVRVDNLTNNVSATAYGSLYVND